MKTSETAPLTSNVERSEEKASENEFDKLRDKPSASNALAKSKQHGGESSPSSSNVISIGTHKGFYVAPKKQSTENDISNSKKKEPENKESSKKRFSFKLAGSLRRSLDDQPNFEPKDTNRREITIPFLQLGRLVPYADRKTIGLDNVPNFSVILQNKRRHSSHGSNSNDSNEKDEDTLVPLNKAPESGNATSKFRFSIFAV